MGPSQWLRNKATGLKINERSTSQGTWLRPFRVHGFSPRNAGSAISRERYRLISANLSVSVCPSLPSSVVPVVVIPSLLAVTR